MTAPSCDWRHAFKAPTYPAHIARFNWSVPSCARFTGLSRLCRGTPHLRARSDSSWVSGARLSSMAMVCHHSRAESELTRR